jgi:hypothetical protein
MTEYWKLVGERAKEKGVQMPNFGGGPTTPTKFWWASHHHNQNEIIAFLERIAELVLT